MSIEFTPTQDDTIAAYRRHNRGQLFSRRSLIAFLVSMAILSVAAFSLVQLQDWPWIVVIIVGGAIGGAIGAVSQTIFAVPRVARRIYRQQASLHSPFSVDWSEAGVAAKSATVTALTPWADYRRWREDDQVILLYHSDALFQFVPKRVLTAAQIDQLRALAAAAGVSGAAQAKTNGDSNG